MSVTLEDAVARLERELGAAWVSADEGERGRHAVDGLRPRVVCRPKDAEQIAAVVRLCAEAGAAVTPWGGGTAMGLGNLPHRVDVILRTDRLDALIEHDDANLTATVEAGMALGTLNARLGNRRQFLALDPPYPEASTVGGVLAANLNGPRRMTYGGARDLVIGLRVVLPNGERIRSGGKVVKNVAGYDMCKLFTGSLGTLGVITEATFKMTPLPEAEATVLARGPAGTAMRVVDELFASILQPTAITVTNALDDLPRGTQALAVAAEGFTEAVERHVRDLEAMAGEAGMSVEVLREDRHRALWARLRDFPGSGEAVIRLAVPPAWVEAALRTVEGLHRGTGHAVAGSPGGAVWMAHAASGTIFVRLPAGAAGAAFAALSGVAQAHRGHVVLIAAPPDVKQDLDVWGPPPPALALMREIKRQFDPDGLLNPGRFVAHL